MKFFRQLLYPRMTSSDSLSQISILPPELLDQILYELTAKDLLGRCSLVCRLWNSRLSDAFWAEKCRRDKVEIPPRSDLDINFALICLKRPYGRNLVRNPSGEELLLHWQFSRPGVAVEKPPVGVDNTAEFPSCFAFTYQPITKRQEIDLIKSGCQPEILDGLKPTVVISEWHSHRFDCASTYSLRCALLDANRQILDEKSLSPSCSVAQWLGGPWEFVSLEFRDYPVGLRFVVMESQGEDNQFWAGHYGPKMTRADVQLHFVTN